MTKVIKTIVDLVQKAQEREDGFAEINGRMTYWGGGKGDLRQKYAVQINGTLVTLVHWGTVTLQLDLATNELVHWYGESNSDRDSMNTLCHFLGLPYRFSYKPVNGGFVLND